MKEELSKCVCPDTGYEFDPYQVGLIGSGRALGAMSLASGRFMKFETQRAWKGIERTQFSVRTSTGSCGLPFKAGENYLVFAERDPQTNQWATHRCLPSGELSKADKMLTTLGAGAEVGKAFAVSLRRSPCFGSCPAYDLTVLGNGRVFFNGRWPVKHTGPRSKTIPDARIQDLRREISHSGFFERFAEQYVNYEITDAASAVVSVTDGKRTKTVSHYFGDSKAPKELKVLEDRIDELAGTDEWVKINFQP
jgi:hypothetical protein